MCADRTIGIPDRDRTLQDGLEGLPDIKTLGLTANEDRYWLEIERRLARRLGRHDAPVLCHGGSFARRRHGIELRLQFSFGRRPLRLELGGPRGCLGFGLLNLLPCRPRAPRHCASTGASAPLPPPPRRLLPPHRPRPAAPRRRGLGGRPRRSSPPRRPGRPPRPRLPPERSSGLRRPLSPPGRRKPT